MDKKLRLKKRKQEAALRARKMNRVANRLLEDRINVLQNSYNKQSKQHLKETKYIEDELETIEPQKSAVQLPRISSSSVSLTGSRPTTKDAERFLCLTCKFGTIKNGRCTYFPCNLPLTYNSMGFQMKPTTYSVLSNYKDLIRQCRDIRPPTSYRVDQTSLADEQEEEEITHKAPRISIKEKERGLKQLIKEMKEKNEKSKPRDWAVNYGDPVPRRMLLKPVIPMSDHDFIS